MRAYARLTILALPAALVTGCAGYAGKDCWSIPAASPVTGLMEDACDGDKAAQLRLAEAYETGEGIEMNPSRALAWYHRAALTEGGQTHVYLPPVGGASHGVVLPIQTGDAKLGSAEAQYRLGLIYRDGRGAKKNIWRAKYWLKKAAKSGHELAAEALAELESEAG